MLRPVIAVVLALVFALTAGCGRDDRAATIDSDGPTSNAESKADAPADGAGQKLTQKQVDAALLTVKDLPSGWALEPSDDEEEDDTIQPAKCGELLDAMDTDDEDVAAKGSRDFNKGGPFGTIMGMSLESYDERIDQNELKDFADVFGECSSFKGTDKDGVVSEYKVSPLSLPNLGDQSLALAMTISSEEVTVSINLYLVGIGHNALTFFNGGLTGADGSELETIGKLAIKRLEDTVKN